MSIVLICKYKGSCAKEKMQFYKQSSFKSVKRFVARYKGKEDSFNIDKRMNLLAEEFYKMING